MYAVKLKIHSPLHIGKEGLGMEESFVSIHSDTLYSAIYSAWQELFPFEGELPFKISSAYPYIENTFFFPKPSLPAPGFEDAEKRDTYAKDVKKTPFVDMDTFQSWINARIIDFERMKENNRRLKSAIANTVRPRVALDRISSASSLYFIGEVLFDKKRDCGLYFLVDSNLENWEKLQRVMLHLGETGIGGERSSGYGRFTPSYVDTFPLPTAETGDKYLTLSLLLPSGKEEAQQAYSYRIIKRGGWSKDTLHKQVYMFTEGSVFSAPVEGKTVIVADVGHPVYRYGRSFMVKAR
jgi:CRISPR-associated protein Csm4